MLAKATIDIQVEKFFLISKHTPHSQSLTISSWRDWQFWDKFVVNIKLILKNWKLIT